MSRQIEGRNMAKITEWTDEQRKQWADWVASRPEIVRILCERLPPDRLYRLAGKNRVTILSYAEDGTVRVSITGEYNRVLFSRNVFGVNPDELEECELPQPGEDLGDTSQEAGYSDEDVREILIPRLKAAMNQA